MTEKSPQSFAKILRRDQTDAEKRLWRQLRSREFLGVKFRRQQPLGPYFADFCSHQKKLIVELDGSQHVSAKEKDLKRTEYLKQSGFKVIRFWDNEVLSNMEGVLERLRKHLIKSPLTPTLSRKGRGGKEEK